MAVLGKGLVEMKTKELENFYHQLIEVLQGKPVDIRKGRFYVSRPESVQDLVEINIDQLLDAVGHFKVSLESLRRLNSSALKASHNPFFNDKEPPPF